MQKNITKNPISINFSLKDDTIDCNTLIPSDKELSTEDINNISQFFIAIETIPMKDLLNQCIYNQYLKFEQQNNQIGVKNIEIILKNINDIYDALKTGDAGPMMSPLEVFHGNNLSLPKGYSYAPPSKRIHEFEIKWTPFFIFEEEDEDAQSSEEENNDEDGGNVITEDFDQENENMHPFAIPSFLFNGGNIIPQEEVRIYTINTNFNISKDIIHILNTEIDGIEGIKVISRYKVRVMIGKLFNLDEIQAEVRLKITAYLKTIHNL